MIECIISWLCLIAGLCYEDPLYFIASALFAIASNMTITITKRW